MEDHQQFDSGYVKRMLILFSAFIILVLYIETMLVPSLPAIAKQYNVNAAEVSLVVSLYLVSGVALNPVVGKLGDIYGKKKVLKYVLPLYVVAVGVTGFSPNFTFLLIARTIQGIGLTIFPLVISLVQEEFPRDKVPRAMAIMTAMFGVGGAVGLPLGSFISNAFGWQATYHTMLPCVLIVSALILVYVRESKFTRPDTEVDYVGALMLAVGLGLIVFALSEGTSYGWTSLPILSMLAVGIAALLVIVPYERRVKDPVLNFKLLNIRNVMCSNLITFIAGMGYFFAYQIFAYLFESPMPLGYGYGIFQTGLAIMPFAVVNVVAAPIAGKWIPKIGAKPFVYAGSVMAIAGFLASAYATTGLGAVMGETVIGLGLALVNIPTINLLVLSIDRKDMGLANSMNAVFRFLGAALGAPIAGLLIAQYESRTAFQYGFYLGIATMVASIVITFFAYEILGKNRRVERLEEQVSI